MTTQVKRRRGTTAQHAAFTGALAELTVDTDLFTVVVHDGATPGGFRLLAGHNNLAELTSPELARDNLGLGNVNNTADADKPVSGPQAVAIAARVAKTANTGSAVVPSGTTAERDAVPAVGYFRYNSTTGEFEGYKATGWGAVGGGATGASGNAVFYENDQTVTADYTITAGKNAMSAGPVTVDTGITVTVPPGSVWTIV